MLDLSTSYMGLKLKSPIIIGSSGLTNSLSEIKKLEEHGAGAVVLKSIFEEQIMMESNAISSEHPVHTEEYDYIRNYTRQNNLENYLKLIKDAKKETTIPIIASINCSSADEWVSYARTIQESGAHALELNMFIIPGSIKQSGESVEKIYFDIIKKVREYVTIPLAVKIGYYFSGLAKTIFDLSVRDINGIVLFNRFYQPDIDLEKETLTGANHIFSTPEEISLPLRWVGMTSDKVKCDLAASTGIHDGFSVAKCLLAGAKAVQVASIIYKKGPQHVEIMLGQLQEWMKGKKYSAIKEFSGKLAQKKIDDPVLYERSQFMKYYSNRD